LKKTVEVVLMAVRDIRMLLLKEHRLQAEILLSVHPQLKKMRLLQVPTVLLQRLLLMIYRTKGRKETVNCLYHQVIGKWVLIWMRIYPLQFVAI
jgi:hypothetical protein